MAVEPATSPVSLDVERVTRHNARWYLAGLVASLLGNSAMSLVAGIWVKSLTGSSAQAGLVSACIYAPTLLAPLAGLLADRVRRRRWLVAINLVSAVTILALLGVRSRGAVWLVFATMLVYGIEATLIDPAEDALFAELFTPEQRRRITGRRLAIQEAGRLVAPLLGAALYVAVGGGAVAVLDAATFAVAAAATARMRVTPPAPPASDATPPPAPEPLGAALSAGARHIWHTPEIRRTAIAAAAVMAVSGVVVPAQYSLVAGLGERPAFLGVLTALLGAGSVVASLSCGRVISRLGERSVAVVGLVDFALGTGLYATGRLATAVLGALVLGFALPYVFLAILNLAQRLTPDALQGRVSAALTLALFGPQAPMQALGSLLISHVPDAKIYLGAGAVSLVVALWLAAPPRRQRSSNSRWNST